MFFLCALSNKLVITDCCSNAGAYAVCFCFFCNVVFIMRIGKLLFKVCTTLLSFLMVVSLNLSSKVNMKLGLQPVTFKMRILAVIYWDEA